MSDPNTTHYEVHDEGYYDAEGYWYEPIIADVPTQAEAEEIAEDTGGIVREMSG